MCSQRLQFFDHPFALDFFGGNRLFFQVTIPPGDGLLTGRVKGEIVNAARKAQILQEIATQENIALQQTIAVGDGANDLPMLAVAGLGIAFHAKPVVAQSARHKISTLGLDSILYLIGVRDRDLVA